MATYSLSIYRITIYKHNKPLEHEYLDCFDDGKSLISIINGMLDRWHDERYLNDYSYDAFDDKRVSRIKRDENGGFMHFHVGPCISGIIESGAYGTEESIIDHKTGDERYRKRKNDAQMIPFLFLLLHPKSLNSRLSCIGAHRKQWNIYYVERCYQPRSRKAIDGKAYT